jgi:hypothetical protein
MPAVIKAVLDSANKALLYQTGDGFECVEQEELTGRDAALWALQFHLARTELLVRTYTDLSHPVEAAATAMVESVESLRGYIADLKIGDDFGEDSAAVAAAQIRALNGALDQAIEEYFRARYGTEPRPWCPRACC